MKKVLFLCLILFSQSFAVSFVKSAAGSSSGDNRCKVGFASSVTSGNLLVAAVSWGVTSGNNVTIDSVKDYQGTLFTLVSGSYASRAGNGYAYMRSQIAYATAASSGTDSITIYYSGAGLNSHVAIYELTSGILDQSANGTAVAAVPSAGTLTTSSTNTVSIATGVLENGFGFPSGWFAAGTDWVFKLEQGGGNINATSNYPAFTGPCAASLCVFKESCTPATIARVSSRVDTIGQSGRFRAGTITGTWDSLQISSWPDSTALVSKTTKDTVAYHWKTKKAKTAYKISVFSCTGTKDSTYDTITIAGPSVSYSASPWIDTVDIASPNRDPASTALADSFTLGSTLPTGYMFGFDNGRFSGTPTMDSTKAGYKVYVWRGGFKADSTYDTITVVYGNVRIDSISPDTGAVGSSTTVYGRYFGSSQGSSTIAMGDSTPTVSSWTNTTISYTIPSIDTGCYDIMISDVTTGVADTVVCGFYVSSGSGTGNFLEPVHRHKWGWFWRWGR
jgi:hypothetical protein